jgi:HK97 family phage portal protein
MPERDSRGRFVSKGIAEVSPSQGGAKQATAGSIVGRSASYKALSPRQAYENNIYARKAVSTIAQDIAKANRRLFSRRTGEEITSGEAYEWCKRHITSQTILSLASWYNVEGEMAAWLVPGAIKPAGLRVLDPGQFFPLPYQAKHLEYVEGWGYLDGLVINNVSASVQFPREQVIFDANWNPNHPLRGLSPAATGIMEISTNYFSGRYNASYFQNGASKSIVIRFPKGTSHDVARDWVKKWESQHSIFNGSAFTVSAIIGDDMQIEEPGMTNRDGQFLELRKLNSDDIMALWGVPAILFNAANAKYDSADAQLESYYENTLLPQMTFVSEFIQRQIIDVHFRSSAGSNKKSVKLLSHTRKAYERQAEQAESDICFVLDPDSLPIAGKLRLAQIDAMDKYRRATASTFAAAAEWAGVDRESNEADDVIMVANDQQPAVQSEPEPQPDPQLEEEVKALQAKLAELSETKEVSKADRERLTALKGFYGAYRALVIAQAVEHKRFDKQAAHKLAEEHGVLDLLRVPIAAHHLAVKAILAGGGDVKEQVKQLLNAASKPAALKQLLGDK